MRLSNAPAKAHDDGVPCQTPAGKQRCNAIGDLVLVLRVDFGQLFLGHIEVAPINFGNLLELHNGLAEASLANQPARRLDDISAGSQREKGMMGIQIRFDRTEAMVQLNCLRDLLGEN